MGRSHVTSSAEIVTTLDASDKRKQSLGFTAESDWTDFPPASISPSYRKGQMKQPKTYTANHPMLIAKSGDPARGLWKKPDPKKPKR